MSIIPKLSVRILPHIFNTRYRLARWTRKSKTFGKIIERLLFHEDDMIVLPKDSVAKTIDVNIDVSSSGDRTVVPSDVVKEIIRESGNIFIMNFCLCRKSNKCHDYPVDHGCIFLGKGIHKIPPEFGRVATPEEAVTYIDECSDLGLVHIIGRNKLDSIWLHTGSKKDLMTICNCCPCCCLWNVVRDISDDISGTFRKMDGVEVSVDTDKCIGCGKCEKICFSKAISITDGKCTIDAKCRGCGRCADVCPKKAIEITFDPSLVDGQIAKLRELVDLS